MEAEMTAGVAAAHAGPRGLRCLRGRDGVLTRDRIHPWQFALALCAVLVPLPPAIGFARFTDLPGQPLAVAVTAAFVASPLLLHHRRDTFARAARIMAGVLLPWVYSRRHGRDGGLLPRRPATTPGLLRGPAPGAVAAAAAFASGLLLAAAMTAVPGYWPVS